MASQGSIMPEGLSEMIRAAGDQARKSRHDDPKQNTTKRAKLSCQSTESPSEGHAPSTGTTIIEGMKKEPIHEFAVPTGTEKFELNAPFPWDDSVTFLDSSVEEWPKVKHEKIIKAKHDKISNDFRKASDFTEDLKKFYRLYNSIGIVFTGLWEEDDGDLFGQVFVLTKRLVSAQNMMRSHGRNTHVDIGYHYTDEANLIKIRQEGLLTKAERDDRGIKVKHNGSAIGDGIYTGNNPFAYSEYGTLGLFVARLRGSESTVCPSQRTQQPHWEDQHDSKSFRQMFVLKTSRQCVPLVAYSASLLNSKGDPGNKRILEVHMKLQEIIDRHFNDGKQTAVTAPMKRQYRRISPAQAGSKPTMRQPGPTIRPAQVRRRGQTNSPANANKPQNPGNAAAAAAATNNGTAGPTSRNLAVKAPPPPSHPAIGDSSPGTEQKNLNQKVGLNIPDKANCKPSAGEDDGIREISLRTVREEMRKHKGQVPVKRLMRTFGGLKKSSHESPARRKAFHEAIKELCFLHVDAVHGRVLVLKQQYRIANASSVKQPKSTIQ